MKFDKYAVLLFAIAFGLFIFSLNVLTPFCSDDCGYGLVQGNSEVGVIPSHLGTVINAFYATVDEPHRPVVHFFVRLFVGVCETKLPFNIFNSLFAVCLIFFVVKLAKRCRRFAFEDVVLSTTVIYSLLFKGESYLWCSGSLNYLWSGVAMLLFLLFVKRLECKNVSWIEIALVAPFLLLTGWTQEAFTVPVCFGLGIYSLFQVKTLSAKQWVSYSCYGVGAVLLVLEAIGWVNVRGTSPFQSSGGVLTSVMINLIKICITIKVFWCVVVVWIFAKDKIDFFKRNRLEFLIVLGSVLMIVTVGFNGERSLWAANLIMTVVLVRELPISRLVSVVLMCVLSLLCGFVLRDAVVVCRNFDGFKNMYLSSADNVAIQEWVNWGLCSRYLFQFVFTWQNCCHAQWYAWYNGRQDAPLTLTPIMYEDLYMSDNICRIENRLPIEGEFYTRKDINAIVMKLDAVATGEYRADVAYALPHGLVSNLKFQAMQRTPPPVPNHHLPVILETKHGKYLLIPKMTASDDYIRDVKLEKL